MESLMALRALRLSVVRPEIEAAQVRALAGAYAEVIENHVVVSPRALRLRDLPSSCLPGIDRHVSVSLGPAVRLLQAKRTIQFVDVPRLESPSQRGPVRVQAPPSVWMLVLSLSKRSTRKCSWTFSEAVLGSSSRTCR